MKPFGIIESGRTGVLAMQMGSLTGFEHGEAEETESEDDEGVILLIETYPRVVKGKSLLI